MKFLLALAFLTVVCAIPRPERIPASNEEVEQWQPSQGSRDGDIQVGNGIGASPPEQLGNSDESDEAEYDDGEDDPDEELNINSFINALSRIREALRKKIKEKLDQRNTETRVPANEDSLNNTADPPEHDIESEGPSSDHIDLSQNKSAVTTGNDTAADHEPRINITLIQKEIHDKIKNIISNILRPWLGNNSVEDDGGNTTTVDPPQNANNTEPPQIASNATRGNDTASDNSVLENNLGTNETIDSEPENERVDRSEPISSSEVSQGVQVSGKLALQSQVRFVNTYSR